MTRLQKLQALMVENNVPEIVVYEHDSIYYLTGVKTSPTIVLQGLVVKQTGKAKLFYFNIQRYEFRYHNAEEVELHPYSRYIKPIEYLRSIIGKDVYFDKSFPSGDLMNLAKDNDFKYHIDTLVDSMRSSKDEYEIECMKKAAKYSDDAMLFAKSLLKVGVKPSEVKAQVIKYIKSLPDCELAFIPFIMFDKNATYNRMIEDTPFTETSYAMIDLGAKYKGYCGDTTRMYFHRCNKVEYELYLQMQEAMAEAKKAVKPGNTMADVDNASIAVIKKYGHIDNHFFHTGHSVGIGIHELDYVGCINDDVILKEGMIFSIEPGAYYMGEKAARVEDLVLVTKDGCESLNKTPKDDPFLD